MFLGDEFATFPRRCRTMPLKVDTSLPHLSKGKQMLIRHDTFFSIFGRPKVHPGPPAGLITDTELAAMIALLRTFHCTRVAEFGVGTGATALRILQSCPALQSYVGLDVPPGTVPSLAYQAEEVPSDAAHFALGDPRFKLIVRSGGTLQTSAKELAPLDFVFIDGDHSVEGVQNDTDLARRAMTNGVICWHDYDNAPAIGPKTVIDQLNATEGDHICLIEGTKLCFEIRRVERGQEKDFHSGGESGTKRVSTDNGVVVADCAEPQRTTRIRRGLRCIVL